MILEHMGLNDTREVGKWELYAKKEKTENVVKM